MYTHTYTHTCTQRSWLRYPAYQIAYFIWGKFAVVVCYVLLMSLLGLPIAWVLYMVVVWFIAVLIGVILALAKLAVEVAILVVAILWYVPAFPQPL